MEWKRLSGPFSLLKGGIRQRLLIWGLALLGMSLILNTLVGSIYTRRQIIRAAGELQTEVASLAARRIQSFMNSKLERLMDTAVTMSLHELGSAEQRLLALLLQKNDRAFTEIAILDNRGTEVVKLSERRVYLPSELSDQRDSEKFKRAIKGEEYIGPVYFSDKAEPYVTMAVPLRVTPLETIGVVVAETYLKFLWEAIAEVEFGKAGYAYLVDGQGNLIAYKDPSLVLKRTNLSHMHQIQDFLRNATGKDSHPGRENKGILGNSVLSTFAPVPQLGWGVILEEPADVALAGVRKLERFAFLLLGMGLLGGAALIVWVSNRITKPIRQLHRGAEIIGGGNLDHRVDIRTGDEIGELAQEFNKMAGELKTSYATLEQRVEQRTQELSALYSLTATVSQSLELNTVLKEAAGKVLGVLPFDACRIYFLDHERKELRLKEHIGINEESLAQSAIYKVGVGINGKVAESGEALLFEDVETDPRYPQFAYSGLAKRAGFRTLVSYPIKVKGKVQGIIDLLSAAPRRFTPEMIQLISSVADQIGVAIDKATLFEEAVKRAQELSALYHITATVNQSLELEPVLEEVIKKVTEVFHFDATRIFLFNPRRDELHLQASFETQAEFWTGLRVFQRGQGVIGRVAETGEPIIFEDAMTDPRYQELSQSKAAQKAGLSFFAAFPIRTKTKPVGVITFMGKFPRKLADNEVRLLTSMAEGIGVAVENGRLFEETASRAQQLSALYDVTTTASQSLELEPVMQEVIKKMTEIFHFGTMRLYLFNAKMDELHVRASFPSDRDDLQRVRVFRRGEGIVGKVAETGEAIIFEDATSDRRYKELSRTKNSQQTGFRFFAAFPIKAKLKPVGAIICNSKTPRQLRTDEVQLITSMLDQIGVAVENARLFEETATRAKELSALYSISTGINQSLDIELVLRGVMHKVLEVFDFDAGRIYLAGQDGKELRLIAHEGFPDGIPLPVSYEAGEGIMGRIFESEEPLFIEDIQTDPEFEKMARRRVMLQAGYRSQFWMPVQAKGKVIGVVNCVSKKSHRFSANEIQLIRSIMSHVGIAVENANLFSELKGRTAELQKANRELEAANRAKEDFLAAMSHELRTPLNVIIGNADLLKDGIFGGVGDKQKDALHKILHYSENLLQLINNVLALTRVGAGRMSLNLSTFRVEDIISHVQNYVEQLNRNGRLQILWRVEPNLTSMTTDALKLEEILMNLIGNAYKFTLKGKIEIWVRDLREKNRLEFSVADTGIGIAKTEVNKIFEQFYQLGDAHTGDYTGMGLGLSIIKQYLEMMRGDMQVESKPGGGSTFTFTLPYSIEDRIQ